MKKFILLFAFVASLIVVNAQDEVMLHLAPRLGTAPFALNTVIDHPSSAYQMKYTRFEYYISEIKITHDGGQVTPVADLYLLVRPAQDSLYSLGQMPNVQSIEAITFSIGVDEVTNHLDPASYPASHALAPKNPEMHWGWAAGYRFAAIEGEAGTNLSQNFQVHALGDANYKTQTITTGAEQVDANTKMIHLKADYSQAMKNIAINGGLIVHGSTGAAVSLLNNFKNVVFTANSPTGLIGTSFTGTFVVSPNPAIGVTPSVKVSLPTGHGFAITVTDLTGKVISRKKLTTGDNQSIFLDAMPSLGLYFVHLWENDRPVAVEKLVIVQ